MSSYPCIKLLLLFLYFPEFTLQQKKEAMWYENTYVTTEDEYAAAASLFRQYAEWLNIDLSFQHFEEELKQLKEMYAAPFGGIIICKSKTNYIGCIALRKIDTEIAELKRMY